MWKGRSHEMGHLSKISEVGWLVYLWGRALQAEGVADAKVLGWVCLVCRRRAEVGAGWGWGQVVGTVLEKRWVRKWIFSQVGEQWWTAPELHFWKQCWSRNPPHPLLCSGKWLIAKNHPSAYDLDMVHGWPPCLPRTRPDTDPSIPILGIIRSDQLLYLQTSLDTGVNSTYPWLTKTPLLKEASSWKVTFPVTCLLLPIQV